MTDQTPDQTDETAPIRRLEEAAQAFINHVSEEAVLLRGAVLAWEMVRFSDEGTMLYRVDYASLADTSPSETVGLLEMGKTKAMRDLGAYREDDEDD